MTPLQAALDYLSRGWSILPVAGKKPIITWKGFQSCYPSPEDIESWYRDNPGANVGIITGRLSNLSIIDIDSDAGKKQVSVLIPEGFRCPVVHTPKGGRHLYCSYSPGMANNVRAIEGVDLRSEGGFVVAPPSVMGGAGWKWDEKDGLDTPIPPLPEGYIKAVIENIVAPAERQFHVLPGLLFREGERNNQLYHLAFKLAAGKMEDREIEEYCLWVASHACYPHDEALTTIRSAVERGKKPERNLTRDVREWVSVSDGEFLVSEVQKSLEIVSKQDKDTVRQAIHKMKKDGLIEKAGRREGAYRRIQTEIAPIDWKNAPTKEHPIKLPLDLSSLVSIFPKNIIVVSGLNNSGKTAFCLDVARLNMLFMPTVFFSSEMGDSELKIRLGKRDDIKLDSWNVEFFERSSNFVDVVRPESLNIIDYLEVNDEFWKVGGILGGIHERLTTGVAVVAIQKGEKGDYGRGATFGAEKPRLYLSMMPGEIKIVKAKNWKGIHNPNGQVRGFRIVGGWKFIEKGPWHYPEPK